MTYIFYVQFPRIPTIGGVRSTTRLLGLLMPGVLSSLE